MKEGWKYKTFGEVGTFLRGKSIQKADFVEHGLPCIHYGQIHTKFGVSVDKHLSEISEEVYNKSIIASPGDVVIAITSEDLEGSCKSTAWLGDYDVAVSSHAAVYKHNLNPKFIAYYLRSNSFFVEKEKYARGFKVMEIKPTDIARIQIPVPSEEIQSRVVSELDKINELIRLKKEQLSDYDKLAQSLFYEMFGDPVENEKRWEVKKLCEVSIYPNKRIALSDITSYEYVGVETLVKNKGGVLFSKELPNAENAIEFIENDILIGNIRPYLKKIWKSDRHGGASGDVVVIRISDSMKEYLNPVYLFKLLSTDEFFEYDNANTHGAKMPRGDRKAIGEFTIQIPSKHLQQTFAQGIELIEQQKAEIQSTIADLETLLASRMQYWFD